MNQLISNLKMNIVFVLEFLAVIAVLFLVAYFAEVLKAKKDQVKRQKIDILRICVIGLFSALATILMLLEIPFPLAPDFYKIDMSELPVLITAFAYGPVAGVLVEFIKIVLKVLIKGTSTAFVGELANFSVGCSLVLPASIVYLFRKKKSGAIIGCVIGTICMTIFGTGFNAVYLLPKFAELFHTKLEYLIAAGTEINKNITDVVSFVFFAVAPLNLVKGSVVSAITIVVYKPLSKIIKASNVESKRKKETDEEKKMA